MDFRCKKKILDKAFELTEKMKVIESTLPVMEYLHSEKYKILSAQRNILMEILDPHWPVHLEEIRNQISEGLAQTLKTQQ
jgi:hypothetical protein